jgi:hypothetical protein
VIARERDQHDTACPRCGGEAEWSFASVEKTRIEIMCQDCGRFQMPRDEFDRAAAENAEIGDSETAR